MKTVKTYGIIALFFLTAAIVIRYVVGWIVILVHFINKYW